MNHNRRSAITTTEHTRGKRDALEAILGPHTATSVKRDEMRELVSFAESLPSESELSTMLAAVAPHHDDFGATHYVFYDSTLGFELPAAVLGLACRGLDIALRDRIAKANQWRGRGPAIVLNKARIIQHIAAAWRGDSFEIREHIRKKAIGLTLHEAAHYLETQIDRDEPDEIQVFDAAVRQSATKFESWSSREYRLPEGPPWRDHGFHFVRMLSHLVARFERSGGERFPRRFAFNHDGYELFPLSQYIDSLHGEIETLRDEPFATIRATLAPEKYIETFRHSLHLWARFCDDPEAAPLHIAAELAQFIRAGLNDPLGR